MRFAEFTPFHILQLSVFCKGLSLYLHQKLQVDIYIIFVIWHVTQCAQPIILFNMFMYYDDLVKEIKEDFFKDMLL